MSIEVFTKDEVDKKISAAISYVTSNDTNIRSGLHGLARHQAGVISDLRKQFADLTGRVKTLTGRVKTLETPKTYTTAELPSNGTTVVWDGNKQEWVVRIICDGWYYDAVTCHQTQSEACERAKSLAWRCGIPFAGVRERV